MEARVMAEDRLEIVTGAAVLAAAIGFLAYAMGGDRLGIGGDSYQLSASFRSVEGIGVGTDVRMAGVKIGTISDLSLNPETFFADAKIEVQNDILLPDDSAILISSEGLLGGNYVELVPGGSLETIPPGGEIEDTQGAVSLLNLLMKWIGGSGDTKAPA
jgi:phospholipid/cholesterol/gamma-HCH transport system substrate-binding protein